MRVYVDIVTLMPTAELWERSPIIQTCTAKRGDGGVLEILFHRSGVPELLPLGTVVTYIVKTRGKFDQNPGLCELEITTRPATGAEFYIGEPDYNTATLDAELESGDGDDSNDVDFVLGDGEISWLLPTPGAKPKSSLTFPVTIYNDVKKGNEGPPASGAPGYLTAAQSDARYVHAVDGKVPVEQLPDATESAIGASRRATQAEAEAGANNTAHMTALRVWQAIAAWWTALSVPWAKLTGQPTTLAGYGITNGVPSTRTVSAGNGLTGGGDLSANRTLAVDPATLSDAQTGTNTAKPIVSSVLAGWWTWVKTQAITLGQTSARIFFRISGSNASNNSPLISMFRSGTSEIVISVQGGGLGNPLVFSLNPSTTNDADLLSSAKFSIGNNGIDAPGYFTLGGNLTGNGTNNTLPNQSMSSAPSIATRSTGDGRWARLGVANDFTARSAYLATNKVLTVGDFGSGRWYYVENDYGNGEIVPFSAGNWEGYGFEDGKRRVGIDISLSDPSTSASAAVKVYGSAGTWGLGGTDFISKEIRFGSHSFAPMDVVLAPGDQEALRATTTLIWALKRILATQQITSKGVAGMYGGAAVVELISAPDNNDIAIFFDASNATVGAARWSLGVQMNSSGFGGDGSMVLYNYADGNKRFKFGLDGSLTVNGGGISAAGNITAAGTNSTLPNQTAASGPSIMTRDLSDARYGGPVYYAKLASDQTITSNTTLTDATGVTISLPAGTFSLQVIGQFNMASTTPGVKAGWDSSNAIGTALTEFFGSHLTSPTVGMSNSSTTSALRQSIGGTTDWFYRSDGVITVTTPSTIKFQFAQFVSSADALTLKAGSYILARKIQ